MKKKNKTREVYVYLDLYASTGSWSEDIIPEPFLNRYVTTKRKQSRCGTRRRRSKHDQGAKNRIVRSTVENNLRYRSDSPEGRLEATTTEAVFGRKQTKRAANIIPRVRNSSGLTSRRFRCIRKTGENRAKTRNAFVRRGRPR